MFKNYKFVSFEDLYKEVQTNENIKLYSINEHQYVIPTKTAIKDYSKYFTGCNSIWISTSYFKFPNTTVPNLCSQDFIFGLENNLIYKHNDTKDDWSWGKGRHLKMYMHNPELYYKLKGK